MANLAYDREQVRIDQTVVRGKGSAAQSRIAPVQFDGRVSNFRWRFKPVNGRSRKPATRPIAPGRKTGHNGTPITAPKLGAAFGLYLFD